MEERDTKKRIEACATKEFLDKGFNGASLRRIVAEAGVTTGAFYKYYPTKQALFAGLVDPAVRHIYDLFDTNYQAFIEQDLDGQAEHMNANADVLTRQFVDYVYDHHDVMKLVLTASEGTPYVSFVHDLARREEESTLAFARLMCENGMDVPELDEAFVHMVASGLFASAFEIVLHDMDREAAYRRIRLLKRFYSAGWEKVLGITFSPSGEP